MRFSQAASLGLLALGLFLDGARASGQPPAPPGRGIRDPWGAEETAELDRGLDAAKQQYREGRFSEAVDQLEALVPRLKELRQSKNRKPRLLGAYLHLALCDLALGERPAAKEALQEMLRIDSKQRLDPDLYAPKVLELLEAARSELAPQGRLGRY